MHSECKEARKQWLFRAEIALVGVFRKDKETGGAKLLRLSVQKNEYIMVGKDVKITFLGGVKNQAHIMIDAPKEINIARGRAIEKRESRIKNL